MYREVHNLHVIVWDSWENSNQDLPICHFVWNNRILFFFLSFVTVVFPEFSTLVYLVLVLGATGFELQLWGGRSSWSV